MDTGLWLHRLCSQTIDQAVLVAQKIIHIVRLVGTLNEIKIYLLISVFYKKILLA